MADKRQCLGDKACINLYMDGTPSIDDYKRKDEQ